MSVKDDILQSKDLKREAVQVPEWTTRPISIREMCERDYFSYVLGIVQQKEGVAPANAHQIRARLIVRCLYDDELNERVFSDDEVDLLLTKSKPVLDRLFPIAQRLNAMTQGEEDDLSKHSGTVPISSSTSS